MHAGYGSFTADDRSIRETGNGVLMMNPVIAILSVTLSTPPQP